MDTIDTPGYLVRKHEFIALVDIELEIVRVGIGDEGSDDDFGTAQLFAIELEFDIADFERMLERIANPIAEIAVMASRVLRHQRDVPLQEVDEDRVALVCPGGCEIDVSLAAQEVELQIPLSFFDYVGNLDFHMVAELLLTLGPALEQVVDLTPLADPLEMVLEEYQFLRAVEVWRRQNGGSSRHYRRKQQDRYDNCDNAAYWHIGQLLQNTDPKGSLWQPNRNPGRSPARLPSDPLQRDRLYQALPNNRPDSQAKKPFDSDFTGGAVLTEAEAAAADGAALRGAPAERVTGLLPRLVA